MNSKSSKKTSCSESAAVPLPPQVSEIRAKCEASLEHFRVGKPLWGSGEIYINWPDDDIEYTKRANRIISLSSEMLVHIENCELFWLKKDFTKAGALLLKIGNLYERLNALEAVAASRASGAAKTIAATRQKTAAFVQKAHEIAPSLQKGSRRPTKKEVWHATADTLPPAERIEYSAFCEHFTFTGGK